MYGTAAAISVASAMVTIMDEDPPRESIMGWITRGISFISYTAYDLLVRNHLRSFYFQTMYDGKPPEDICAQKSGMPSAHFTSTPENMAACEEIMEKLFRSWDSAAMFLIHFGLLAFVIIRLILCVTSRSSGSGCRCGCAYNAHNAGIGYNGSGRSEVSTRVISVEELRAMIEMVAAERRSTANNTKPQT